MREGETEKENDRAQEREREREKCEERREIGRACAGKGFDRRRKGVNGNAMCNVSSLTYCHMTSYIVMGRKFQFCD